MTAIGLEMDLAADLAAAVAAVRDEETQRFRIDVVFYGPADLAAAEVARAAAEAGGAGAWLDPMPNAGLLPSLRKAGVWVHLMEAVDVAAASYEFKAGVRGRLVTAGPHEALREAMKYAVRRPLAAAFAFERRRVACDMSVLNAAAFAMWGAKVPAAEIF